MSSIAYVTDNKMIEFHRINGSNTMNFWRLSTHKKFSDFSKGDILFFLTKERSKQKEKSIVGYGICDEINKMSLNQMWKKYDVLNGYTSKEELENAIAKASKDNKIPKLLSCIFLKNITFFQSPIYLSDFNIKISNKLESYIYLDKEDKNLTSKILLDASTSGIDLWISATSNINQNINEIRIIHDLNNYIDKMFNFKYTKQNKIINKLISNFKDLKKLKNDNIIYYKYTDELLLVIPMIFNQKNFKEVFNKTIGIINILKYYLNKNEIKHRFEVIFDKEIDEEYKEILKEINK